MNFFFSNGCVSYVEGALQPLRPCGPERNVEECYGRFDHLLSVIVIYLFINSSDDGLWVLFFDFDGWLRGITVTPNRTYFENSSKPN